MSRLTVIIISDYSFSIFIYALAFLLLQGTTKVMRTLSRIQGEVNMMNVKNYCEVYYLILTKQNLI